MSVGTINGSLFQTNLTSNGALYDDSTGIVHSTSAGTTGQFLGGNTGSAPTFQTINVASWSIISSSQALAVNSGYVCVSPGGALALSLPATSAVGSIIEVTLDGATSWQITQGAGQSIKLGNLTTTAGVSGSLTSTQQGDSMRMVCSVANLKWNILSSMGNPTIA